MYGFFISLVHSNLIWNFLADISDNSKQQKRSGCKNAAIDKHLKKEKYVLKQKREYS